MSEDQARRIADVFGLFGSPERCAEQLLRAREEAGVDDVFLFPAHDLDAVRDVEADPELGRAEVEPE